MSSNPCLQLCGPCKNVRLELCAAVWLQAKVRDHGFGLQPRLNALLVTTAPQLWRYLINTFILSTITDYELCVCDVRCPSNGWRWSLFWVELSTTRVTYGATVKEFFFYKQQFRCHFVFSYVAVVLRHRICYRPIVLLTSSLWNRYNMT